MGPVTGQGLSAEDRPAIVGRAVELAMAVEYVVAHGQILVTGEAGVGKSTLLDAVARELATQGFDVVRVTGNAQLTDHPLAALGHLIGDPGRRRGPALTAFATERLRGLARGSKAVIVVDDAHVLDPWSLQVITQARVDDGPRTVFAARTTGDLTDAVLAVGRHPGMRLEMQRLSVDETAALVVGVLGGPLDTPSAMRVHQATDGLPLAVVELVRYALRRGALVERSGLYRWKPGDAVDRHLAGLLGLRVDDLDADERDVIDVLTIVGQLPASVLQRVAPGADLVAMELERLIRATPRPGWSMIGHPLLRDAAAALLAPVRRHDLSRRIAAALEGESDAELARTGVVLAVDVGAPVAPAALLATVEWARAHAAWTSMLPLLERGWVDLPGPTTGLAYGEALYWTRRMTEAERVLTEALSLCRTDRERIAISTARARALDIGLGRGDEADAIRVAQFTDPQQDPADRLEAWCAQAERWLFGGEVDRILDILTWATKVEVDDVEATFGAARYRLTQSSVAALGLSGQIAGMTQEYALHLELSTVHADAHPLGREVVDPWWASCNVSAGRPGAVRDLIRERYEAAIAIHDGLSRPLWALPRAIERMLAGDLVAAEHFAREAMGVPPEVVSIRRMATHHLARILDLAGRHDEALVQARATAGADYVGIVRPWSLGIEHRSLMALAPASAPDQARDSLRRARAGIDDALACGQRVPAAYMAHDLLGWGNGSELVELLDGIEHACDAPTVRWMAAHARARSGNALRALLDAAEEAGDAGVHAMAYVLAQDAVNLAVVRRDPSNAARAAALVGRCRASTTGFAAPGGGSDLAGRFGLTPRESEIMRAASAGLTDQAIAADFVISVRTVNAHLRSIYRKTGVGGRRELASLRTVDD